MLAMNNMNVKLKKNRIPLTTAQKTKGNICKSKKTCRELGCQTRQNANKRNQRSK